MLCFHLCTPDGHRRGSIEGACKSTIDMHTHSHRRANEYTHSDGQLAYQVSLPALPGASTPTRSTCGAAHAPHTPRYHHTCIPPVPAASSWHDMHHIASADLSDRPSRISLPHLEHADLAHEQLMQPHRRARERTPFRPELACCFSARAGRRLRSRHRWNGPGALQVGGARQLK